MLRTIIIDDEAHIRDTLARLLAGYCPQVSLVGEAGGVAEGIRVIQKLHPGLVLMDIQLKDGTGFDLLHALGEIDFKIILVSAGDKETTSAIRLSGIEYLLKPVSPAGLSAAVKHAEETTQKELALQLRALEANLRSIRYR
jgi:two-component system, LytTR family, response regulator